MRKMKGRKGPKPMKTTNLVASISITLTLAAAGCASHTPAPASAWEVRFDAAAGQLPEGLAVRDGVTYVGMATLQEVVRSVDGVTEPFATFPRLGQGQGFLTGLTFDAQGNLYAGLASFTPDVQTGIYRVPASGGAATLFATHAEMAFPNDLLWNDGSLYVTDSMAGAIWRINPGPGSSTTVERWLVDPILTGDPSVCAPDEVGFGIGANGIEVGPDGAFYVAVTDRATLVRIPRQDGVAGTPAPLAAPNCALLEGADGLVWRDGAFVVASNRIDRIVRVDLDGTATALVDRGDLDFPASIVATDDGVLVTNFGLLRATSGAARPGLLHINLP
jgi:sugar lactone lactonase YvrE